MRIPLMLAVILILLSVLVDLYITFDLRKTKRQSLHGGHGNAWKVYLASSVMCWIWLLVILCLPKRSEDSDILSLMWMLYSYLTIYAAKITYIVVSLIGRLISFVTRCNTVRKPFKWIAMSVGLATFAMMWIGVWVTRRQIMVTEVTIDSPKIPEAFNGYRIVQISDLHVGTWGEDTSFIKSLVEKVNSLHPDLILFTGDIVNRKTDELTPFLFDLSQFSAADGVMSVLGNHDYGDYVDWKNPQERIANNELLHQEQRGMGWDLLQDEHRLIVRNNDTIVIAGVENWGDPPFPTYGNLDKALSDSKDSLINRHDSHFKILMTHNPEHWNREIASKSNIDLTLSGHTHAMQMMVGNLQGWKWSPAVYRYSLWGGLYERQGNDGTPVRLYVNIGAGEVGMPSRLLGARPEVTLLVLHHTERSE